MKLNPKVFNKAANRIASEGGTRFACFAIQDVIGLKFANGYKNKLKEYFDETGNPAFFSFDAEGYLDPEFLPRTELGKLRRQLALDLLAEIVKDENRRVK